MFDETDPKGTILAETKRKKLRFSDVAYAVETTPKALRKMLQNPQVMLPVPVSEGWTEFTMVQIAVLALSRRFIEFGCSVQYASINSCLMVRESIATVPKKAAKNFTAAAFLNALSNSFAFVYFDEGIHKIEMKHAKRCPPIADHLKSRAVLIIPVGEVVKRAFDRALVDTAGDMVGSGMSLAEALVHFRMEFRVASEDSPAAIVGSGYEGRKK